MSIFGSGLSSQGGVGGLAILPTSQANVTVFVNEFAAPLFSVSPTQVNIQVPYVTGAGTAVLSVNRNGTALYLFPVAAAVPGIFTDAGGNLAPNATASAGQAPLCSLRATETSGRCLRSECLPNGSQQPTRPVTVTVAGLPATVSSAALAVGIVGVTQVNFTISAGVARGPQPAVATVRGATSQTATATIVQ